jgi:hypothetical protein
MTDLKFLKNRPLVPRGVVNFYSAGVVTHDHRIGSGLALTLLYFFNRQRWNFTGLRGRISTRSSKGNTQDQKTRFRQGEIIDMYEIHGEWINKTREIFLP